MAQSIKLEQLLKEPRAVMAGHIGVLKNRHSAKIHADGTLVAHDQRGSIHQVGAALEGAPSCNGWTYWCFKKRGEAIPIDMLRKKIRAEMTP